jgi:hypothetical protein
MELEQWLIRIHLMANPVRAMGGLPPHACVWNVLVWGTDPADAVSKVGLGADCIGVEAILVNDRR